MNYLILPVLGIMTHKLCKQKLKTKHVIVFFDMTCVICYCHSASPHPDIQILGEVLWEFLGVDVPLGP